MIVLFLLAAAAAQPSSPSAATPVAPSAPQQSPAWHEPDPLHAQLEEAAKLVLAGRAADALPLLEKLIAAEEGAHRDEKRMIFSARSLTETILYGGMAGGMKKNAVMLDGTWSTAYFLKAFALVDLNRADEAKAYLDKAVALAPQNAQFLAERGEWYKNRRNWDAAYKDFASASVAANFSPDPLKSSEQRRAWRGMAFARTEQRKLDEARDLLQKCLTLEPSDEKCRHELDYVNGLNAK